jgi:hypothetical protein
MRFSPEPRPRGLAARLPQDAREGEVHALQGAERPDLQRGGWSAERPDELVGALMALPPSQTPG